LGTLWTQGQAPQTLNLINDVALAVYADFPARAHADWHFWDLTHRRRPFDIADTGFAPKIRVIDDWFTNRDLALVAEAQLGKGRLLLCAADIESDLAARPVALAFRNALAYHAAKRDAKAPNMTRARVQAWWQRSTESVLG
jgi:hypothetical protein